MNYVYIIECSDKTLYTGWTTDLQRRIKQHNNGKGAKYTRSRTPVRLMYYEQYNTKKKAMQREYEIKKMTRKAKLKMF